jgi:hypothetical protein
MKIKTPRQIKVRKQLLIKYASQLIKQGYRFPTEYLKDLYL